MVQTLITSLSFSRYTHLRPSLLPPIFGCFGTGQVSCTISSRIFCARFWSNSSSDSSNPCFKAPSTSLFQSSMILSTDAPLYKAALRHNRSLAKPRNGAKSENLVTTRNHPESTVPRGTKKQVGSLATPAYIEAAQPASAVRLWRARDPGQNIPVAGCFSAVRLRSP